MTKPSVIHIDGHKPIELMTETERDEFYMKEFGMTYSEFLDDAKKHRDEPMFDENAVFLE